MWLLLLVLLAQTPGGESLHVERNPVYREVLETGIKVTPAEHFKLMPPYLADGLDAAAQRKLIEKLGGRRYPWEVLTRQSTVAPQIIPPIEEKSPNADTKARIVHVYFVAHGNFEAIAKGGEKNHD
jgi:hypothetical protein